MSAEDTYNMYEERQVAGLSDTLKQIKTAAKINQQLSISLRKDRFSEEQAKALRRRKYHVHYPSLSGNQVVEKVIVSWDPKLTGL